MRRSMLTLAPLLQLLLLLVSLQYSVGINCAVGIAKDLDSENVASMCYAIRRGNTTDAQSAKEKLFANDAQIAECNTNDFCNIMPLSNGVKKYSNEKLSPPARLKCFTGQLHKFGDNKCQSSYCAQWKVANSNDFHIGCGNHCPSNSTCYKCNTEDNCHAMKKLIQDEIVDKSINKTINKIRCAVGQLKLGISKICHTGYCSQYKINSKSQKGFALACNNDNGVTGEDNTTLIGKCNVKHLCNLMPIAKGNLEGEDTIQSNLIQSNPIKCLNGLLTKLGDAVCHAGYCTWKHNVGQEIHDVGCGGDCKEEDGCKQCNATDNCHIEMLMNTEKGRFLKTKNRIAKKIASRQQSTLLSDLSTTAAATAATTTKITKPIRCAVGVQNNYAEVCRSGVCAQYSFRGSKSPVYMLRCQREGFDSFGKLSRLSSTSYGTCDSELCNTLPLQGRRVSENYTRQPLLCLDGYYTRLGDALCDKGYCTMSINNLFEWKLGCGDCKSQLNCFKCNDEDNCHIKKLQSEIKITVDSTATSRVSEADSSPNWRTTKISATTRFSSTQSDGQLKPFKSDKDKPVKAADKFQPFLSAVITAIYTLATSTGSIK